MVTAIVLLSLHLLRRGEKWLTGTEQLSDPEGELPSLAKTDRSVGIGKCYLDALLMSS